MVLPASIFQASVSSLSLALQLAPPAPAVNDDGLANELRWLCSRQSDCRQHIFFKVLCCLLLHELKHLVAMRCSMKRIFCKFSVLEFPKAQGKTVFWACILPASSLLEAYNLDAQRPFFRKMHSKVWPAACLKHDSFQTIKLKLAKEI